MKTLSTSDYGVETHKLAFHPKRVSQWLTGKSTYPIYVEVSITNSCNLKCSFCALAYNRCRPSALDKAVLIKRLREMHNLGVKSIMFAGSGEPTMHPDVEEIIVNAKKIGFDVAMSTNGVELEKIDMKAILKHLSWIRVSVSSGSGAGYAEIHGAGKENFNRVIDNIGKMSSVNSRNGFGCTIGVQYLLLPGNQHETEKAARLVKLKGADYFSVKPYSEHPQNRIGKYRNIDYSGYLGLEERLLRLSDRHFNVIFRKHSMKKTSAPKEYGQCLGLPFFSYIESTGEVYPCIAVIGSAEYSLGNINEDNFRKIWNSRKKAAVFKKLNGIEPRRCVYPCRLDEINKYLWGLKNPQAHVNFI